MANDSMENSAMTDFPLEPGEEILVVFQPDLNDRKGYERSSVVLTSRRLRHRGDDGAWFDIGTPSDHDLAVAAYNEDPGRFGLEALR